MVELTVDTGDILKWAKHMEEKGADFGAEVLKEVKRHHEGRRKQGQVRFSKIRRHKTGVKRFAIVASPDKPALETKERLKQRFDDIFKE
jgi:hypothetical protein